MRLIFLDVDDVLNSVKSTIALGTCPHPFYPFNKGDEMNQYIVGLNGIDPVPAGLINKLAYSTDSDIVISSTWRIGQSLPRLTKVMESLGISRELIIGKTDTEGNSRGEEIARFLSSMGTAEGVDRLCKEGLLDSSFLGCKEISVESYVIIDDSMDMTKHQRKHHFVRVAQREGLSLADVLKAGRILTKKPFDIQQLCKKREE